MEELKQYQDQITSWIDSVRQLGNGELWEHVVTICGGGKRFRPELIFLIYRAYAKDRAIAEQLVKDASAIELLHTSTLIHDDIIDKSDFRRNIATLHSKYNPEIALLVGNLIKDHALTLSSPNAYKLINEASRDVNLGQLWETQARTLPEASLADYFAISLYKAARIFRYCIKITSLYVPEPIPVEIEPAVELIALVYQAVDDWIDTVDVPDITKKSYGRDIDNKVYSFMRVKWFKDPFTTRVALPSFTNREAIDQTIEILTGLDTKPRPGLTITDLSPQEASSLIHSFCVNAREVALSYASSSRVGTVLDNYFDRLINLVETC